jgi:hypothetical protein
MSGTTADASDVSIAAIETEITTHLDAIADLRDRGARVLADRQAVGAQILRWLTGWGATEPDARTLCIEIIQERRAERAP